LQAKEFPGIKIFRFESALFYANAEYFRNELIRKINLDPNDANRNSVDSNQEHRISYVASDRHSPVDDPEGINSDVQSDGSVVIENVANGVNNIDFHKVKLSIFSPCYINLFFVCLID